MKRFRPALVEPLRPRPIRAAVGAIAVGIVFGLMDASGTSQLPPNLFSGYVLGCGLGGMLFGAMRPFLRHRLGAAAVAAISFFCGALVAGELWHEENVVFVSVVWGCVAAVVYPMLVWNYQPNGASGVNER